MAVRGRIEQYESLKAADELAIAGFETRLEELSAGREDLVRFASVNSILALAEM